MHILNYYFTPFAVVLILFAIFFSEPERQVTYASFAILAAAFAFNFWFSRNTYRFMGWIARARALVVWVNLLTAAALFYLLGSYWAPMWLLFTIPPAAGAMFMGKWKVFFTAVTASLVMLTIYLVKGAAFALSVDPELTLRAALAQTMASTQLWGQAAIQAIFLVFFAMFVAAMSEMILKVRDTMR